MGACISAKVESKYVMEKVERKLHFEVPLGSAVPAQAMATNVSASRGDLFRGSSGVITTQQPSQKLLDRRRSSSNIQFGSEKGVMGRRSSSSSVLAQGHAKTNGPTDIRVSSVHSWLLKDAHITSTQVDSIEDVRILGKGLMGTVRLAKWKYMENDLYFAIKSVNKEYIIKHNDARHVTNEREILRSLSSPFVIRLFGTHQDDDNIYYMLEYAAGGELFHRLMKKRSFPAQVAKFYASEIFLALEHVQSLGYVYRDLKPENVMLDSSGHCKLVDFGFSRTPNKNGLCSTNCGTPAYLSPEQLNGKFTNGYTRVVDWWSFGCLIFELMTGLTPFCKKFHDSAYEIYMRVLNGSISFPGSFDKDTKELIKNLLRHDIKQRLVDPLLIKNAAYFSFPNCSWADVETRRVHPPFTPVIKDCGDSYYFDDAPKDRHPRKPFKRHQGTNCANYMHGF